MNDKKLSALKRARATMVSSSAARGGIKQGIMGLKGAGKSASGSEKEMGRTATRMDGDSSHELNGMKYRG